MKKEMIVLVFAIFMIASVSAIGFQKDVSTDVIIKEFNQPAKFTLTLTDVSGGDYQLYTLTDVSLSPKGYFSLPSGTSAMEVGVYRTEDLKQEGYYSFVYYLKKYNGDNYEDRMMVKVLPLEDVIEISSDTIAPDAKEVTFYIQNNERAELNNVKVKFNSIFFTDLEKEISLKPFEKVEISVPVESQKMKTTKAGAYIIKADFKTDSGVKRVEGKIYLGEKKDIRTEEDSSGFIIYTDTVTKMNTGNVPQEVNVVMKRNIITRLFTSFNNEPDAVERAGLGVKYTWNENLEPTDIFVVKAKTNYVFPVFVLLFAGIILFVFKRYTETKLEVRKSVSSVKAKGGELALRVTVRVKARRSVENVSIIDRMPALVKIYESFGVLKPSKVDAANRRIHWNLGDLQSGEERIVSYIIYSKIGVVGKFSLPSALTVFEKDAKIHEIESNNVFFLAEQAKRDF